MEFPRSFPCKPSRNIVQEPSGLPEDTIQVLGTPNLHMFLSVLHVAHPSTKQMGGDPQTNAAAGEGWGAAGPDGCRLFLSPNPSCLQGEGVGVAQFHLSRHPKKHLKTEPFHFAGVGMSLGPGQQRLSKASPPQASARASREGRPARPRPNLRLDAGS